jgi:4-amino-4-deoxy-L-arabinose transferase-like glycosyltransferase
MPSTNVQRQSIDFRLFRWRSVAPSALPLAILVAAAALRAYWIIHHATLIMGVGYVRIAENLLNRGSYVGLFEGPELVFPPFFPALLAFSTLLAGSVEGAARLIAFVAGVLLVPIAFALARLMYGPRVALWIAVLTALHPALIDLSSTAESETVYLPLMFVGLYWAMRALDSGSLRHTVWCGTMFGLAYLTRPEALLFPVVLSGAMLLTGLRNPVCTKRVVFRCLCLFAPILALGTPWVIYLSLHTGGLRLDGKGIINYTIGARRNSGMSHAEAALGVGPDLSEEGPQLSPNHFIMAAHHPPSAREVVSYWFKSARRNKATLFDLLISPVFGSVLGIGLTALGLFGRPWDQRRAVREAVLLGIALAHVFLFLGLHVVLFRYVLPLMTVTLLWVAKGIDEVARWGVGTARRAVPLLRLAPRRVDLGVRSVLIGALLLVMLWGLRWGSPLQAYGPSIGSLKEVGTWLARYRPGSKRVMTTHPQIPYYSHGTLLLMPYAEGSLALQYVRQKRPDFIVLLEEDRLIAPCLKQWLDDGIPDRAATLIYQSRGVVIYEWHAEDNLRLGAAKTSKITGTP